MKEVIFKAVNGLLSNIDRDQKAILAVASICGLLGAFVAPTINKFIMSNISERFIAFQGIAGITGALIAECSWKASKFSARIKKSFVALILVENLLCVGLVSYLIFVDKNVELYAIGSVVTSTLIGEYTSLAIRSFKNHLWSGDDRDRYDNNQGIVGGIVAVSGLFLAAIVIPTVDQALWIWAAETGFSGLGWVIVYRRHRSELVGDKKD